MKEADQAAPNVIQQAKFVCAGDTQAVYTLTSYASYWASKVSSCWGSHKVFIFCYLVVSIAVFKLKFTTIFSCNFSRSLIVNELKDILLLVACLIFHEIPGDTSEVAFRDECCE